MSRVVTRKYWLAAVLPCFALSLVPGAGITAAEEPPGAGPEPRGIVELWVNAYGYKQGWLVERHPRILSDVNGDRKQDIVAFGDDGVYVSVSTGAVFTTPARWLNAYGYNAGGWQVDRHPRMMADVDGDGKHDIVGFGNDGAHVSLSTGAAFTAPEVWVKAYGAETGWIGEQYPRMMADVDGDGKQDIVAFGNDGVYVSLSAGKAFRAPELWVNDFGYVAGEWRTEKYPRTLADVNGDGKQDIIGFRDAGAYVSLSTGTAFTAPALWVEYYGYLAGGFRVEEHPRILADMDGDGKQDIVGFANAGVYVSRSIGTAFASPELWIMEYGYLTGWRAGAHLRLLADVNGDGKQDVVGFKDAGVYFSLSTGRSLVPPVLWVKNFGTATGWHIDRHPRMMADVTGNGIADVVGFANVGTFVSPI